MSTIHKTVMATTLNGTQQFSDIGQTFRPLGASAIKVNYRSGNELQQRELAEQEQFLKKALGLPPAAARDSEDPSHINMTQGGHGSAAPTEPPNRSIYPRVNQAQLDDFLRLARPRAPGEARGSGSSTGSMMD